MNIDTQAPESNMTGLSAFWVEVFGFYDKIGMANRSYLATLKDPENVKIIKGLSGANKRNFFFNAPACILGPLWYFSKKMWFKGAAMLGLLSLFCCFLSLLGIVMDVSIPVQFYLAGLVVPATAANIDYYRYIKNNETMWSFAPKILSNKNAVWGFPVVALVMFLSVASLHTGSVGEVEDLVKRGIKEDVQYKNAKIKSVILAKKSKNNYVGIVKIDDGTNINTYRVTATYDGRAVVWALSN